MSDTTDAASAANGDLYLSEFLYRGRGPGSKETPDYHVVLAQDSKDAFGNTQTAYSQPMTPDQAKDHGFNLATIVEGLNAGLAAESAAANAAREAAEKERDAAKADPNSARAQLAAGPAALAPSPAAT